MFLGGRRGDLRSRNGGAYRGTGYLDPFCSFLFALRHVNTLYILIQNSALRESNARGYVRKFPFAIEKAEGIILTDTDGKQYYDCLGVAGTLALGHNHPVLHDAIRSVSFASETSAMLQC